MGAAYFYHLTRHPLDVTLRTLLEKSLQAGWRVVVRGRDAAQIDRLDERLWAGDGFLPHGRAGGPHDADQPVLLTEAPQGLGNAAQCLMVIDGAGTSAEECALLERVCVLFDGNDPAAVDLARAQWKALTAAGTPAQYWSEDSGRWQKKAETPSASEPAGSG